MIPATEKEFVESNFTFNKPADMTDEQCSSLRVFKGQDSEGMPVIISKWKLNPEDLKLLNETGEIYLTICGNGMPPVGLSVESPFK